MVVVAKVCTAGAKVEWNEEKLQKKVWTDQIDKKEKRNKAFGRLCNFIFRRYSTKSALSYSLMASTGTDVKFQELFNV